MRLRSKQVTNRSDPLLRIRPVASAFAIPRKERDQRTKSDEFRPVGICTGHKNIKSGNCFPECSQLRRTFPGDPYGFFSSSLVLFSTTPCPSRKCRPQFTTYPYNKPDTENRN